MRNLNTEIELKREQESLMSVRTHLYSMSDAEFRQYWVRVGQYFKMFTAYISHLTSDELHQFNMLGPVNTLSRGMAKDVVFADACPTPSGDAAGKVPGTSVNEPLEEPVEVR